MLSLRVLDDDLSFLVDTGATLSTLNSEPPQEAISSRTVNIVGFSGVGQKLPVTIPLKTQLGKQTLLHPFVVSPGVPVNLLGRDLLIKLGASILCSPDGNTVTLPDGTCLRCNPNTHGAGQYLLKPLEDELVDIYWGMLQPETPLYNSLLSAYLQWKPWISLLEPYVPPPDPPHVTLFYDRMSNEWYQEEFEAHLEDFSKQVQDKRQAKVEGILPTADWVLLKVIKRKWAEPRWTGPFQGINESCPLESDRNAYYDSSQSTIKGNCESIRQLRQENRRLHRKVVETKAGDELIIKGAFHNRGVEKDVFSCMSGKEAITTLDQKVLMKNKHLNALKHTTQTYQQCFDELRMEYQRLKPETDDDAHALKRLQEAMRLRALENRLEKTQFKCKEAENIMTNYLKLKSHLQEESLTFQGQLDNLEAVILKHREEFYSLQVMNTEAQLVKESAKAELRQQEELLYKERKERERTIASHRKKVEEHKAQAEKVDRRAQRTTLQADELSSEVQHSTTRMTGEEEKTISTYEEAFYRIKEATGVTNVQEIEERFISQRQTHQHLERLKEENEKHLLKWKEQKEHLKQEFEDIKYSGETKISSDQQMLEICEQQLQAGQKKCDAIIEHLDWLAQTLSAVQAGVEHLADKLQHISLETINEDMAAEVLPDSGESVLELMMQCELKLHLLHKELQGKDHAAIMKEMEEEEFLVRIEGTLPIYNTRIKLSEDQKLDLFDSEDNIDENEVADIISRDALKRQSQLIIEAKSKKKPWKKSKGKL
ncbi:coiled-coil domain-containing protein 151 [Aulostomus maculatus]